MQINLLNRTEWGVIENGEFKGFHLFSNGAKGTARPDNFGAVYVFNDDLFFPKSYLGMHPHANVEVITVMLEGAESHEDSLGHRQRIEKGAVQLISGGTGIRHAGGNVSAAENSRLLQIWIVPNVLNTTPTVQLKQPDAAIAKNVWSRKISPDGNDDSLIIKQDVWLFQGLFEKGDATYELQKKGNGVMMYITEGSIALGDSTFNKEDALFITEAEEIAMSVDDTASILLIETVM